LVVRFARRHGRSFGILLLYALLAIAFMSPIASNTTLSKYRESEEYHYIQMISQAKKALDEGQFPLRVSPDRWFGWRFPLYQFYCPGTYMLAGYVQKWFFPENTLVTFKVVMVLAMVIGGFYAYKLSHYLSRSRNASIVAGGMFVTAPFILHEIHIHGHVSQGLSIAAVIVAVYYGLRAFASPRFIHTLLSSIAWALLALIYSNTFMFGGLACAGLLLLFSRFDRKTVARLARAGSAVVIAVFLAGWHLFPTAAVQDLFEYQFPKFVLRWSDLLGQGGYGQAIALPLLFCPVSTPLIDSPFWALLFYTFRIGWPMVFAAGIVIYALALDRCAHTFPNRAIAARLVSLLLGVVFFIWSPLPVSLPMWRLLPELFQKIQYPGRLLIQVMWIGAPLGACALVYVFGHRMRMPHVVLGLFLVGWAGSTALPTDKTWAPDKQVELIPQADLLDFSTCYQHNRGWPLNSLSSSEPQGNLVMNRHVYATNQLFGNVENPILTDFNHFLTTEPITNMTPKWRKRCEAARWWIGTEATLPVPSSGPPSAVRLVGSVLGKCWMTTDDITEPVTLTMWVNGAPACSQTLEPRQSFDLKMPLNIPTGDRTFRLKFTADRSLVIDRPGMVADNLGRDRAAIALQYIGFEGLAPEQCVVPVKEVQKHCVQRGETTECEIIVPQHAHIVQLPSIYYPGMIDVRVDGRPLSYFPTFQWPWFWLTSVRLEPGFHRIEFRFQGLPWANWLSGVAWIAVLGALLGLESRKAVLRLVGSGKRGYR
jgi:hypothetical protein